MQQATVVFGIDDALGGARQAGEILRAIQFTQCLIILERNLKRDVIGQSAAFDQAMHVRKDAAMHRLVKVFGPQEFADPMIGFVIDQDRAKQRLFGFYIVRLSAKPGGGPALDRHLGMHIGEHHGTITRYRGHVRR